MLFLHPIALRIIGILGPRAAENTLGAENTNDPSSKGCKNLPFLLDPRAPFWNAFLFLDFIARARYFENPFRLTDWIVMLSSSADYILCPVDASRTWRDYISESHSYLYFSSLSLVITFGLSRTRAVFLRLNYVNSWNLPIPFHVPYLQFHLGTFSNKGPHEIPLI